MKNINTMNTIKILEKLIREIKSNDSLEIKPDDLLIKDLSFSSLESLQLLDKIQEHFQFMFEIEDYHDKNFKDVKSMINIINLRKEKVNEFS